MGALCLSPPLRADVILRFTAFLTKRVATWDKHKAPTLLTSTGKVLQRTGVLECL